MLSYSVHGATAGAGAGAADSVPADSTAAAASSPPQNTSSKPSRPQNCWLEQGDLTGNIYMYRFVS